MTISTVQLCSQSLVNIATSPYSSPACTVTWGGSGAVITGFDTAIIRITPISPISVNYLVSLQIVMTNNVSNPGGTVIYMFAMPGLNYISNGGAYVTTGAKTFTKIDPFSDGIDYIEFYISMGGAQNTLISSILLTYDLPIFANVPSFSITAAKATVSLVNYRKGCTAIGIISGALRILQVLSPDVSLTDSEAQDALDCLNLMLDGWSNESLMITNVTSEIFPLTINQSTYTLGPGGNFDTARPMQIEKATFNVNGIDYPLDLLEYDDWAAIKLKSLVGGFPQYCYIEKTYPLEVVHIYPTPNAPVSLSLYTRKEFTQFHTLNSPVELPPGYCRAMKYCLAVEIAHEYQTTAGADVMTLAISAKAGIKRTNKRPITAQIDIALTGKNGSGFNIYRGN